MSLRAWLLPGLLVAAIGWWVSPLSPHAPAAAKAADGTTPACPRPARVAPGQRFLQSEVPASMAPFRLSSASLRPLAGFSIEARVLAREDYRLGREAEFSPTDLVLGWGRMREQEVLSRLEISQSARWYHYRWRGEPPLPPQEIAGSSANMHMIPADFASAAALRRVRAGERVRIDGWLVQVEANDGWRWRSSLSRDDTGSGACEVVYVCSIHSE